MTETEISKIQKFISKLVILLEDEFSQLELNESKNAIATKKKITDMLNTLVAVIIQLNTLTTKQKKPKSMILKEDEEIIKRFLIRRLHPPAKLISEEEFAGRLEATKAEQIFYRNKVK